MAKAKSGAKTASPAKKVPSSKPSLLKTAAKTAAKLVQAAAKVATKPKAAKPKAEKPKAEKPKAEKAVKAKVEKAPAAKGEKGDKAARREKLAKAAEKISGKAKEAPGKARSAAAEEAPAPAPVAEKPHPRATRLPPPGEPLTKREMEQLLTAGAGRGVVGEGSLKGRLVVKDEMPCLVVIGRDKRELTFLLQGPDQEVLPAYVEHKVSVSGLIKKTNNYGGTVDVRKYSAKKPETETAPEPEVAEHKLRFLSPGEVEQISSPGMGAGMRGFANIRGNLEMTGEEFFLVVSNGGTRQQVSFILEGKNAKGLRKHLGQTLQVTGVLDKTSGWGGKIEVETFEPRPAEFKAVSRDALDVVEVEVLDFEGVEGPTTAEVKLNHGLSVRLPERPGHTWAIEPTVAKRVGLREANFEPVQGGPGNREFFFTPRNPGAFEVEFFLAKAFNPAQVSNTFKLQVVVKP